MSPPAAIKRTPKVPINFTDLTRLQIRGGSREPPRRPTPLVDSNDNACFSKPTSDGKAPSTLLGWPIDVYVSSVASTFKNLRGLRRRRTVHRKLRNRYHQVQPRCRCQSQSAATHFWTSIAGWTAIERFYLEGEPRLGSPIDTPDFYCS
jgi:hypothetical protein